MRIICPECKRSFIKDPQSVFCPFCGSLADPDVIVKKTLENMTHPTPVQSGWAPYKTGEDRIFSWKKNKKR